MADDLSERATRPKVTVPRITTMKGSGELISMITAYDATFAALVDRAGIDMILVGDSVGTVVQGRPSTVGVTLKVMQYHVRMVHRAGPQALVVGDLPFGSYQAGLGQAVDSAITLLKAGAESVKLEGGTSVAAQIEAMTRVDIPVVGHIGLTPQSYHRMGGHKVQGKAGGNQAGQRDRLIDDAHAVEQAGGFAVVLEGIPRDLAAEITSKLSIPTIGIGAGPDCDGQVLVLHDVLGLEDRIAPKFVRRYASLKADGTAALAAFADDVRSGAFPDEAETYHLAPEVAAELGVETMGAPQAAPGPDDAADVAQLYGGATISA